MKITDIITKKTKFKRRKVFRIAFSESMYSEGVYVKIVTDEGIYGMGEASPAAFVTGETIDGVIAAVEFMKPALIGADPEDPETIHKIMDSKLAGNTSAKAAIDIACYDIMGKAKGLPVHRLLGATQTVLTTDMTIGIDTTEKMVEDALERVSQGFHCLKIKAGINPEEDLEHLAAIRQAVGPDIDIRVDANQGYDIETAAEVLKKFPELGISEAEQPLVSWDLDGMAELKKLSPVPLLIDEGVHSPVHARWSCEKDSGEAINIKLMKCGGIWPALQINEIAKANGKTCIVGCMSETKLGLAAGAAVVAACYDNMEPVVDLDSFMSFVEGEGGVTGGFTVDGDKITLSEKPGFGFDDYEF